MSFIHSIDYESHIKAEHLLQLVANDTDLLDKAERFAESKVTAYLRGKFDLLQVFPVILDYTADVTYTTGGYVRHADGKIYEVKPAADGSDQTVVNITPSDPTGADFWQLNDPRNPVIVDLIVTLTLCHIHKRISPKNIPDFREADCKAAMKDLERISKAEIDAGLPKLEGANIKPVIVSDPKQDWYF